MDNGCTFQSNISLAVLKRSVKAEIPKSGKGFAGGDPDELAAGLHNIRSRLRNAVQVASFLMLVYAV